MTNRRSFLKTLAVLGATVFVAPLQAIGIVKKRTKLIINGVELPLPKVVEISIDVAGEETMKSISIVITGGKLSVINPDGPAILLEAGRDAKVLFKGPEGIMISGASGAFTFDAFDHNGISIYVPSGSDFSKSDPIHSLSVKRGWEC